MDKHFKLFFLLCLLELCIAPNPEENIVSTGPKHFVVSHNDDDLGTSLLETSRDLDSVDVNAEVISTDHTATSGEQNGLGCSRLDHSFEHDFNNEMHIKLTSTPKKKQRSVHHPRRLDVSIIQNKTVDCSTSSEHTNRDLGMSLVLDASFNTAEGDVKRSQEQDLLSSAETSLMDDFLGMSIDHSSSGSGSNSIAESRKSICVDDLSRILSNITEDLNSLDLSSSAFYADRLANVNPIRKSKEKSKGGLSKKSLLLAKKMKSESENLRPGCKHQCLKDITGLCVQSARQRLYTKSLDNRIEWLYDRFFECLKNGKQYFFTIDDGRKVCTPCFMEFYSLPKNFYYRYLLKYKNNCLAPGWRRTRGKTEALEIAEYWLKDYAIFYGDRMPDKNDILLPYKTQKKRVYLKYQEEEIKTGSPIISHTAFLRMWKESYPHLKIKQTNSFSKCETCTLLERLMERTRDPYQRGIIRKRVEVHNSRQMEERRHYHHKRKLAKDHPKDYLSLIIDGMDQSKTNLPHMTGRKSKSLDPTSMLQTHVQGILNHGINEFHTYVDLGEYAHDSNMVMNTILKHLHYMSEHMKGKLPRTFYIQADNCFRENKNRFMLAFCELLVHLNIFHEINLSFLFVGHTHEDVDAGFSKIAKNLRKNDAETMPRLLHMLPKSKQLNGLYDIKKWMSPYINRIQHHTKPLHFRFFKTSSGEMVTEYKGLHSRPWIRFDINVLSKIPQGSPKILLPSKLNKIDFNGIKKNIENCKLLLLDESSSKYNWWMRFLAYYTKLTTSTAELKAYAQKDAVWVLPLLPRQPVRSWPQSNNDEDVIPQQLQDKIDDELRDPLVIVRRNMRQTKKTKSRTEKNVGKGGKRKGFMHMCKSEGTFIAVPYDLSKEIVGKPLCFELVIDTSVQEPVKKKPRIEVEVKTVDTGSTAKEKKQLNWPKDGMECLVDACGSKRYNTYRQFMRHWNEIHVANKCKYFCTVPGCKVFKMHRNELGRHIRDAHGHSVEEAREAASSCIVELNVKNKHYISPGDKRPPVYGEKSSEKDSEPVVASADIIIIN